MFKAKSNLKISKSDILVLKIGIFSIGNFERGHFEEKIDIFHSKIERNQYDYAFS